MVFFGLMVFGDCSSCFFVLPMCSFFIPVGDEGA